MIAVVSANGKLTHGNDTHIYSWTSKEDQDFFQDKIKQAKLIIMGSATYEVVRKQIKNIPGRLRIVLTHNLEKYRKDQMPGILEFSSETPLQLIDRLTNYKEVLVVGGSKIYSAFMKAGLINEIYLTIEPVIFGEGKELFESGELNQKLRLMLSKNLNKKGTLLLKYQVTK